MKLVSGIVDSGFFAQSALSAEVATKDSLGRNISETYLTGVDQVISSYATATNVNSAIITNLNDLELSARIAYNARTAYYDQNGVNLANATNSAKSGYAASAWINAHSSDYQTTANMVNYQLTADMTGYQSAGDYYSASNPSGFLVVDDITGKLDASVYAADSGSFLTAVPAGTMNESAFGYDANDKISGYNGSAFAGGSDVPEGVMVESGLEYNAVNEISAYNGSAIAQYGAEKQWLVTDDTLLTLSNSAQFALGVNLSAVAQLLGVDETVLWSGSIAVTTAQNVLNLSESLNNFKYFKIYDKSIDRNDVVTRVTEFNSVSSEIYFGTEDAWVDSWQPTTEGCCYMGHNYYSANYNRDKIATLRSFYKYLSEGVAETTRNQGSIKMIVGIGRKA